MQPSWGEPLWELQDVRPLRSPTLRSYFFYVIAAPTALSTTTTLLNIPCRCRDPHFHLASIPAGRGAAASCTTPAFGPAGVSRLVSYLPLPRVLLRLPMPPSFFCRFSPIKVRFLIIREAVGHDGPNVFGLPLAIPAPSDCRLHKLI